ncbi:hypothetical protein M569_14823, partial [Genlisea aurea]
MSHRNPPPISHNTAGEILKQTNSIFRSHLLSFVCLSTLVLAFRSNVHTASHYLSSLIDGDPALKSLLSRLDLSAAAPNLNHQQLHSRRRRAFLHLSRVGTLEDDFFSGDSDFDRSLFHPPPRKPARNSTYLLLSGGFSDSVIDHGISFPETVKPRLFGFTPDFRYDNSNSTPPDEQQHQEEEEQVLDFDFLAKDLKLGNQDARALVLFVGILSATYAYVVFGFIITYTWVNGIIFLKVLDHLLGNHRSFFRLIWDGSTIGLRKLSGFTLMKWAVKDAVAQLIGILFFGEIEDQYAFIKAFLRMKFMPFADLSPWIIGHEFESSCFAFAWFTADLIVGFVFAVDSWVAIVDSRRSGREILTQGLHLVRALLGASVRMRLSEGLICGWVGKWMLRRMGLGEFSTVAIQSVMEVYFMVAWLVFYLASKCKEDGRSFRRGELEGLVE